MKQNQYISIILNFIVIEMVSLISVTSRNGIELCSMMTSIVCIHKPSIVRATSYLTLFNMLIFASVIFSSNRQGPFNNQWSLFLRQSKAKEDQRISIFVLLTLRETVVSNTLRHLSFHLHFSCL